MRRADRIAKSTRSTAQRQAPEPGMLRGSLIELRRRCGKAACHCREGDPHCCPALSYSQNGKTRIVTLPASEVPRVRAGLKRYQQALRQLERAAMRGIEELKRELRRDQKQPRRARS